MATLSESLLDQLRQRLGPLRISALQPLAGGASSLTYSGTLDGLRVVVKVAPPGVEPIEHRDVLRQARILRALAPTQLPVPDVLFEDSGHPPDVPPLFVMSLLGGITHEPLFDRSSEDSETVVAQRFRNAAAALAQLHRVELRAVGLQSEPVISPPTEVERWCRTLQTVEHDLVPGWPDLAAVLKATAPPALPGAVVHGDFRLGNMLAVGHRITAVIDWEIWSIGDPRIDAGWFLINCDPGTYRRSTRYAPAVPSLTELTGIYRRELGRDVPYLDWFRALACFKSAATWSLIVKHNRRRSTVDPQWEAMVPVLPGLLAQARQLLETL